MANSFLNAQTYSNALMLLLKNSLVWGKLVDGQFKNEVTDENGLTTSIKAPPHFIAQNGAALAAQRMLIGSRTVAVDKYKNVHLSIGDLEYVTSFNDLMKNAAMQSSAAALANAVDADIARTALEFPSTVFTNFGAAIKTTADFNKVHTQLMAQGVPDEQLSAVLAYVDGENIRNQLTGGFIASENVTALHKARVPVMSNIDPYATQVTPTYTNGNHTMSAGPAVSGANQNVNYSSVKTTMSQSFVINGLGNSKTVAAGETFVISGVFEYDWRQGRVLATQQRFTVLPNPATADGAWTTHVSNGSVTVTIAPAIIVPGTSDGVDTIANTAFGTVSAIPADTGAITFDGTTSITYNPRVAFHKRAIALVSAKLQRPFNGEVAFTTDKDTGITIRYWRGSDIATGVHAHRWDMIYGVVNADRRLGARIFGTSA